MKHLTVSNYGQSLGVSGRRLIVKSKGDIILETPLNRLKTITVNKQGVSISSNLIFSCANRGVKIFFVDKFGRQVVSLSGDQFHGTTNVRKNQFKFIDSKNRLNLCSTVINGKILNQRTVLLYFSKYLSKSDPFKSEIIKESAQKLLLTSKKLNRGEYSQDEIFGYEGSCASIYWSALKNTLLKNTSFKSREKRGS